MLRQYKILSDTSTTGLEEAIAAKAKTFKELKVEGFHFDGTDYIALVSYEIYRGEDDENKSS